MKILKYNIKALHILLTIQFYFEKHCIYYSQISFILISSVCIYFFFVYVVYFAVICKKKCSDLSLRKSTSACYYFRDEGDNGDFPEVADVKIPKILQSPDSTVKIWKK